MRDTLRMVRAAASEAGYAGRDRTATVLALVSVVQCQTAKGVSDETADMRARVFAWMLDAFYDEGLNERIERAHLFGPFDYDGDTACAEWVAVQHEWASIRAGVQQRRRERIARN
jgi:hypothetical protein